MKLLGLLVLVSACAATGGDDGDVFEQESSATRYVQILDFEGIDQGAWYDAIHSLNAQFDDACGDAWCEGDFTNYTPLTFACSVTSKLGNVKDCAWTFAASETAVDPKTAAIVDDRPTFECHVAMQTTAKRLAAILAAPDSLYAPLPGAPSIAEQIGDCFERPVSLPAVADGTTYVAASDYYSGPGIDRWLDAKRAVVHGFDNICGDTFCGGDYGDLTSLELECAITRSTGNVKSCAWVFGGSFFWVPDDRSSELVTEHHTYRCDFTMKGTLPQLISTWTAAGSQDAIDRPLPGTTATAYDALLGCLP